jgi:hypothetical protein
VPNDTLPWFADRPGDFVLFRVNRRPLGESTLFPATMPPDVFEHFVGMLAPGWEVESGRRNRRRWRVGGIAIDPEERVLTGKLGWIPEGSEMVAEWSDEEMDWVARPGTPHGNVLPFGFDGDTRLLTVLRDGASAPTTIANVIERVLRENERQSHDPTTEWSVEPVLDRRDFLAWLESLDVVRLVSFTAKLPNPEPEDAFKDVVARMERRQATKFTETLVSDRDGGLSGVQEDRDFRQAVEMGTRGFATLRGEGSVDGNVTKYSQSEAVAKTRVDALPGSWKKMRTMIVELLKDTLRHLIDSDETA